VTKPVFKRYCDQLHRHIGWLATWQPDSPIAVGDVCLMEGRQMVRQFHLDDRGIGCTEIVSPTVAHVGWQSSKGITVKPSAGASATGVGDAHVEVKFEDADAMVFRAERCREHSLDRLDRLKDELLDLRSRGQWDEDLLVVTQVRHAERLLVVVAGERGSSAVVKVAADAFSPGLDLSSANVGVELLRATSTGYQISNARNTTPLFQAVRVRRVGVRREHVIRRIGRKGKLRSGAESYDLVPVDYED